MEAAKIEELSKQTRATLVGWCKDAGLTYNGTKQQLVFRMLHIHASAIPKPARALPKPAPKRPKPGAPASLECLPKHDAVDCEDVTYKLFW